MAVTVSPGKIRLQKKRCRLGSFEQKRGHLRCGQWGCKKGRDNDQLQLCDNRLLGTLPEYREALFLGASNKRMLKQIIIFTNFYIYQKK